MTNAEIQVGKFGRTNLGKILTFAYIENAQGERYKNKVILSDGKKITNDFYYFEKDEKIVKESSNLIDLIEVGDYVNGKLVYSVGTVIGNFPIANHTDGTFTHQNMIKTIVTKEQFKSMEYEVEADD